MALVAFTAIQHWVLPMKLLPFLSSCGLAALAAGPVLADPVNIVAAGTLLGTQVATFDEPGIVGGSLPGTNYNGAVSSGGASFGERFAGQTNTPAGGFDVLSGVPTGNLSLAFGAAGQNLNVVTYTANNNSLGGLGPPAGAGADNNGEGAIAALFSADQSEFGFDLLGADGGSAFLSFFHRDGSLISTIRLDLPGGTVNTVFAFRRDGDVRDIAGVSIYNTDPGGFGIDNVRFNVAGGGGGGTVPEPGSFALAALALLGLGLSARRKAWCARPRNANPSKP